MKNEVALIACCKSKKETNEYTPADELYTGHLFQAQLAYTRQVLGLPDSSIFVLSAYYGLVEIKRSILPYEMSLKDKLPVLRKAWAGRIELSLWNRTLDPETIYMMAGKVYRTAVGKRLRMMGRWTADIVVPHPSSYGYGQQVAWYKAQVKNA